jgi:hypothetical protein
MPKKTDENVRFEIVVNTNISSKIDEYLSVNNSVSF